MKFSAMSCLNASNRRRVKQIALSYENLKSQHEWLLCRKIIVFTGSFLSIIYGLAILTTTQWLQVESNKLSKLLAEPDTMTINNDFYIAFHIMVIGLIGCISPCIRSNKVKPPKTTSDSNNNDGKSPKSINTNKEESRISLTFSSSYWCQILDSVINWVKISPLFTMNAIYIGIMIPIESAITINTCKSLVMSYEEQNNQIIYRLSLSLAILYVSVIMIQICVFIYLVDLVQSHINKRLLERQINPTSRQSMRSKIINSKSNTEKKRHLENEKNRQFSQFMQREKQLSVTPRRLPDLPRTASAASTIQIDQVYPRQSTSSDHYEYVGEQHSIDYEI